MKIIVLKLLFILFVVACSTKTVRVETTNGANEVEITSESEINKASLVNEVEVKEVEGDNNTLQAKSFKGFTKEEIAKFWKVSAAVDKAVNSKCYEDYVLGREKLLTNKGNTRLEVITEHRGKKPALNFVMYYKNNSTVGYTYPNSDTIWMNRKFHRNYSIASAGANLHHETSHKLGYSHDFSRTARRNDQVPYLVGSAVKKCIKNPDYDLGEEPKKKFKTYCKRVWYKLWLGKNCYKVAV